MPDVSTHLMCGIALTILVCHDKSRKEGFLVVIGSVLVDIERPLSWISKYLGFEGISLYTGFHSFLGVLALSFFAASCFQWNDVNFNSRFFIALIIASLVASRIFILSITFSEA